MSDKLFREVITLTKYKLVATHKESDEKVDLRVRGTVANGYEVDLIVTWLFERGKWKIDLIAKVPTDWYPRHWNRRDDSTSGTASKR